MMARRHMFASLAVGAAAVLLMAGCSSGTGPAGSVGAGTSAPAAGSSSAPHGKLKIALANSFIGNGWRVEMENVFKAACAMPPFSQQVDCSVYNSGNSVSTQTQEINNLIAQHVDAIVLDAASVSGLDGVVQQACDKGILVVSFDNVVDAKCALKVNTDQLKFGQELAQYLVDQLHGKGNVIMVTGVAGTGANEQRNQGAKAVFDANPGIKIVATYSGQWDSATAQRETAAQLPSLPRIDGVWVQGGSDGVVKAFIAAHRPIPIFAGESENGFRKYMAGISKPQITAMSIGQPPFLSVMALELAREVLKGQHARTDVMISFPKVTSDQVQVGKTVFPALSDSFFADFTDSGPNAHVILCQSAATQGTACPGTLTVRLGS